VLVARLVQVSGNVNNSDDDVLTLYAIQRLTTPF